VEERRINVRRKTDMGNELTWKSILIPLIVAGIVAGVGLVGNYYVMTYQINEIKIDVKELKVLKLDKDEALRRWNSFDVTLNKLDDNLDYLIRLHMDNVPKRFIPKH
jgi:hypothetical protein